MDFRRKHNAFKAYIKNMVNVNRTNLEFSWTVTDSRGNVISGSAIDTYYNSISVISTLLNIDNQYTVYVEAGDGVFWGNASQTF
jgi:hypothetical protein